MKKIHVSEKITALKKMIIKKFGYQVFLPL